MCSDSDSRKRSIDAQERRSYRARVQGKLMLARTFEQKARGSHHGAEIEDGQDSQKKADEADTRPF